MLVPASAVYRIHVLSTKTKQGGEERQGMGKTAATSDGNRADGMDNCLPSMLLFRAIALWLQNARQSYHEAPSNVQQRRKGGQVRIRGSVFSLLMSSYAYAFSRNRNGRIVKPAQFQAPAKSGEVARIEPNRKWFG